MNSFSAMQKAIEFEIDRQVALVENGEHVKQETRLWEEGSQVHCCHSCCVSLSANYFDLSFFEEPISLITVKMVCQNGKADSILTQ